MTSLAFERDVKRTKANDPGTSISTQSAASLPCWILQTCQWMAARPSGCLRAHALPAPLEQMIGARRILNEWQVPNRYPLFTPTNVHPQIRFSLLREKSALPEPGVLTRFIGSADLAAR